MIRGATRPDTNRRGKALASRGTDTARQRSKVRSLERTMDARRNYSGSAFQRTRGGCRLRRRGAERRGWRAGKHGVSGKNRTERTERVGGGRKPLPANLPRREIVLDLPDSEKICRSCGKILVRIGEDVSERLCIEPVNFFVEKTIRPTYGCGCGCGGVHASPPPERIIPKSIASPSLLSQILASKFCDALPFYRQANILERDGIEISRATMARWALEAHVLLSPLTELIRNKDQDERGHEHGRDPRPRPS